MTINNQGKTDEKNEDATVVRFNYIFDDGIHRKGLNYIYIKDGKVLTSEERKGYW